MKCLVMTPLRYWEIFRKSPWSVKISACEILLVLVLTIHTAIETIIKSIGKPMPYQIGNFIVAMIFVTSFYLLLLRYIRGYKLARTIFCAIVIIPAMLIGLKIGIVGFISLLLPEIVLLLPFWLSSTKRWLKEREYESYK